MAWRPRAAYSQDLRDRVFARCDAGEAVGEIAEALCVTVSSVSKVLSRRNLTGQLSVRPLRAHVLPKLAELYEAIQAEVVSRPDTTLAELCRWLAQTHQVTASIALMHGTLRKLGLTQKTTLHAAEQDRPDVAEAWTAWRDGQSTLESGRLIFVTTWLQASVALHPQSASMA